MQQLIIKKDISESKIAVLLGILRSWEIEAEVRDFPPTAIGENSTVPLEDNPDFWAAVGMWSDYDIDAKELRKKAWGRDNGTMRH